MTRFSVVSDVLPEATTKLSHFGWLLEGGFICSID